MTPWETPDNPCVAELFCGQYGHEAHCAAANDDDGLARASFGGDGGDPAGAEDIGGSQQACDLGSRRSSGVATRVPSASGTRRSSACAPPEPTNSLWMQCDW